MKQSMDHYFLVLVVVLFREKIEKKKEGRKGGRMKKGNKIVCPTMSKNNLMSSHVPEIFIVHQHSNIENCATCAY